MSQESVQIAIATVTTIAPFMPFLMEVGNTASNKVVEVIAEKGGNAIWDKAQFLWDKINPFIKNDPEAQSLATLLAVKPENERRQTDLAEVLAAHLQENPELAQVVFDLLGGHEVVQQVLADHNSWIEDITQKITSHGTQTVKASDNSVIRGVRQIKN